MGASKNVGSFLTEDQPLPPGLHIHFTEPGSIAIKDGHELQAWMLSSSIGRTLSNSGKCPVVTIPMIPSVELDMKGLWEWLRTGGWSDREKLRCPWCCDKNAMQIGRSHLSVLSAMAKRFLPTEAYVPSLQRGRDGLASIHSAICELVASGCKVRIPGSNEAPVSLPTYPFRRKRFWVKLDASPVSAVSAPQVSSGDESGSSLLQDQRVSIWAGPQGGGPGTRGRG